eukprot:TRINITY_DN12530_c0_g1_i15.p1 TRINITY_DN12530_c0_g1~~TRINITY_DN12530_c0_g1_i15.p1  ORF type:complete len:116 (+),score=17.18 TRINITY_DN12530_c0_g1_i15:2-349(+)
MCRFDDGFTDSNSGAQADNKPSGGTCWSTGYIDAETWTYDEVTQTMTIKSIDGQDDRRTKLMVVCSSSSTPQITTKPEDPQRNTTLRSSTTGALQIVALAAIICKSCGVSSLSAI